MPSATVSRVLDASNIPTTIIVGESISRVSDIAMTTTPSSLFELDYMQQQQVIEAGSSILSIDAINHWTPASLASLVHALLASFSVILVSELGDKTFIITAIMAIKNSRALVFIASALALFIMTVLSVVLGVAVTVIPKVYTHYASIILFLCFGLKMLKESYDMNEEAENSEFEEVERSLVEEEQKNADSLQENLSPEKPPVEDVPSEPITAKFVKTIYIAPIIIKVFTMIFLAEWGDRSQISTIILAAREDTIGVFLGSFLGHVFCTGLAVIGGRFVADMISVKTMTLLGGIVFLSFAAFAIISGPE